MLSTFQEACLTGSLNMDRLAKNTLKWDLLRSVPLGFIESIGTTFGVLVLVRVFQGDQWTKALVVAAPPIGLLFSLYVVQLVRRWRVSAGKAMAVLHLIAALGFLLVAGLGESVGVYALGVLLGALGLASALPLMSQIYREHFPNESRGQLFAYGGFVRKISAIVAALVGGWLLKQDQGYYRLLFGLFSLASVVMAVVVLQFQEVKLDSDKRTNVFSAFRHFKLDQEFRHLLISWMVLGVGNLLCMALFVEYITNHDYGYKLDAFQVSMVTTFVPEVVFLCSVLWWGRLFDRWNFYLLRAVLNLLFAVGVVVYFQGNGIWFLVIGIGLHGLAKAGGNVAWSLWVTKFSKPQYVAEYMSVHTFLTGCRGIASPFISLPLALIIPPQWISLVGAGMIIIATLMISPKIKFQTRRREGEPLEPDPRT